MGKKKDTPTPEDAVIASIQEKFGETSIRVLGRAPKAQYKTLPTGSVGLDKALGIGGVPFGRIVEIYGPESSGKTTLTLHLIANAQAQGHPVAFIDAEHALDVKYAAALGVKTAKMAVSQPDSGEEALEIASMLVSSGIYKVIVIDSVAALTPKAELEGDMGASHVGLHARMMSQACRKLKGVTAKSGALVIFINQIRMKIGVKFGSPETTTGGRALAYYSSLRLDMRSIGKVKAGERVVANKTRVRVVKNKVADPFTEAEFQIAFGIGIDRATEIIELGVATKVLTKSGAWISYGDRRLANGRANVAALLREDPKLMAALSAEVMDSLDGVSALALTEAKGLDDGEQKDEVVAEDANKPAKKASKKKAQTSTASEAAAKLRKTGAKK
jgi:recombination protein RecA